MSSLAAGLLFLLARMLAPTDVAGLERASSNRRHIFFANHGSHLDFPVLWATLPRAERLRTRPVAAVDYWGRTRVRRTLARTVRAVLVERAGPDGCASEARAREGVRRMVAAVDAGANLVLFPEGRRVGGRSPSPFRTGLYHLSRIRPEVELVPVLIQDVDRVLPRGSLVPAPRRVRVTFGPPLAHRTGESKEAFLQRARAAVEGLARSPVNDEEAALAASSIRIPAATYSPGRFPSEYHRRWRA